MLYVKKIMFIIIFLLSYYIYAENSFRLDFNIAATGFGINYSSSDDDDIELFAELLTFELIHNDSNIGAGLSPFKYWYNNLWDEFAAIDERQKISFLNFNINWDIIYERSIFFGPFCMINYIFLKNSEINWNNYIFTAGLRFKWVFNLFNDNIFNNFLSSEIGYRNINGISKFHLNVSLDLLTLMYAIAYNGGGYCVK